MPEEKSQRPLWWAIKRLVCCVDAGQGQGESCKGELDGGLA
jgi:hypothetical protein